MDFGKARQGVARRRVEAGERREGLKHARRKFRFQAPPSSSARKRARIAEPQQLISDRPA